MTWCPGRSIATRLQMSSRRWTISILSLSMRLKISNWEQISCFGISFPRRSKALSLKTNTSPPWCIGRSRPLQPKVSGQRIPPASRFTTRGNCCPRPMRRQSNAMLPLCQECVPPGWIARTAALRCLTKSPCYATFQSASCTTLLPGHPLRGNSTSRSRIHSCTGASIHIDRYCTRPLLTH